MAISLGIYTQHFQTNPHLHPSRRMVSLLISARASSACIFPEGDSAASSSDSSSSTLRLVVDNDTWHVFFGWRNHRNFMDSVHVLDCFGDFLMEFDGFWWILLIFRDFLVELDGFCWFLWIFLWNLMFVFLSFRVFLLELLINNVQGYLWILMKLFCNNMCLFNCYLWMMKIVDLT